MNDFPYAQDPSTYTRRPKITLPPLPSGGFTYDFAKPDDAYTAPRPKKSYMPEIPEGFTLIQPETSKPAARPEKLKEKKKSPFNYDEMNLPPPGGTRERNVWDAVHMTDDPEGYLGRMTDAEYLSILYDIPVQTAFTYRDEIMNHLSFDNKEARKEGGTYLKQMYQTGVMTVERGHLGIRAYERGMDPALYKQILEKEKQIEDAVTTTPPNLLYWAFGAASNTIPYTLQGLVEGMKKARYTATAGAAAGSFVPGIGNVAGFLSGLSFGMQWGAGENSLRVETGNTYLDLILMKDDNGNEMNDKLARRLAPVAGGFKSLLEVIGIQDLMRTIPGSEKVMGDAIHKVFWKNLEDGTFKKFIAKYAGHIATETFLEEVPQELTDIFTTELAVALNNHYQGTQFEHNWNAVGPRLLETAKNALAASALLALPGTVSGAIMDGVTAKPQGKTAEGKPLSVEDYWPGALTREEMREGNAPLVNPAKIEEIKNTLKNQALTMEERIKRVIEANPEDQRSVLAALDALSEDEDAAARMTRTAVAEQASDVDAPWRMTAEEWRERAGESGLAEDSRTSSTLAASNEAMDAGTTALRPPDALVGRERIVARLAELGPRMGLSTRQDVETMAGVVDTNARFFGVSVDEYVDGDVSLDVEAGTPAGPLRGAAGSLKITDREGGPARIVTLGNSADQSTFIHEAFHDMVLWGARNREKSPAVAKRMAELEAAFGVEDGNWDAVVESDWADWYAKKAKREGLNLSKYEVAAYALEDYIRTREAPSVQAAGVLQKLAEWLKEIYHSLRNRVALSEPIKQFFDEYFGEETSPVASAQARELEALELFQPSDRGQFQAEADEVRARYEGTDQWMKAPNGQPTNLTERQWVQVRTPSFKKWFGDWEAAAELRVTDANITTKQVVEFLKNLANKELINNETGIKATISRTQRDKLTSAAATKKSIENGFSLNQHNSAVGKIDKLYKHAVMVESRSDKSGDVNIKSIKRFVAPVLFEKETGYANILLKETEEHGHKIYTLELLEINKLQSILSALDKNERAPVWSSPNSIVPFEEIVKRNVSKVVDENGEPMVVYHGTNQEITEFKKDMVGKNYDMSILGFYFTATKEPPLYGASAKEYAKHAVDKSGGSPQIVEAFLSVKNPIYIDSEYSYNANAAIDEDRYVAAEAFVREGKDGAIAKKDGETIIAVRNPTQIKSAVANAGAFDPENPSILYQVKDTEHAAEVERAIAEGKPVPLEVLKEYEGEAWADEELSRREDIARDAADYDPEQVDEFVAFERTMEIPGEERAEDYYRQVFEDAKIDPPSKQPMKKTRAAGNALFIESMTKETLEGFLEWIGAAEKNTEGLHASVITGIKAVGSKGKLSPGHYKSIMDQMKAHPSQYRELFAGLLEDDDALRAMAEEEVDPLTETIERLRRENALLSSKTEKQKITIESLQRQSDWYGKRMKDEGAAKEAEAAARAAEVADLSKSAKAEARKGAAIARENAAKKTKEEIRKTAEEQKERAAAREYGRKLVRTVMKPPSYGTMDLKYADKIKTIQNGFSMKGPKSNEYQFREQLKTYLEANPDYAAQASDAVKREAARRYIGDLTLDEMENVANEIRVLKDAGRRELLRKKTAEALFIHGERGKIVEALRTAKGGEIAAYGTEEADRVLKGKIGDRLAASLYRIVRLAEILDGNQEDGPTKRWLFQEVNKATDAKLRSMDERTEAVVAKLKNLDIDKKRLRQRYTAGQGRKAKTLSVDKIITVYMYSQNEQALSHLVHGNLFSLEDIEAFTANLTDKEKTFAEYLMNDVFGNENFDRLQEVFGEMENKRMVKVARYFPIRVMAAGTYVDIRAEMAADLLSQKGYKRPGVKKGFTVERVPMSDKPIRLGALAITLDQLDKQEHYIAHTQLVRRLNKLFGDREVQGTMAAKFGGDMVQAVTEYMNEVASPMQYKSRDAVSRVFNRLMVNYQTAALSFNALTVLKNATGFLYYLPHTNEAFLMRAVGEGLVNYKQLKDFVETRDPQVKHSSLDPYQFLLRALGDEGFDRVTKAIGEAGMKPLEIMDKYTRIVGWKAVYDFELSKGADEATAIRKAQEATLKTQPTGAGKDLPALYRNEKVRPFLMFSNQLNQNLNMIAYDMTMAGRRGKLLRVTRYLTAFAITGYLMGIMGRRRHQDDLKEVILDVAGQFIEPLPFVGSTIMAAVSGEGYMSKGVDFFGPSILAAGRAVWTIADSDKDAEQKLAAAEKLVIEAARVLGVPSAQGHKIYKAVKNRDVVELLGSRR